MKKGFVLVEVLIWMSLFLITAGCTIGISHSIYQARQLDCSINQLVQDLQTIRVKSISTKQDLKIVFYPMNNKYRFELEENGFLIEGKNIIRTLPDGVGYPIFYGITAPAYRDEYGSIATGSIAFGTTSSPVLPVTVWFKQAGTPSSGGHIILTTRSNGRSSVVIVKPVTGRVRIGRVAFYNMD